MIKRAPTLGESVLALLSMVVIITVGYIGFGVRVEPLMIISAIVAGLLARRVGMRWKDIENAICQKLIQATPAILIMWTIGMVIATFIFSGSIPMIIYYGLEIINPQYLYVCAFLVCVVLSIVTGTSWGSAGTIGVAMMGVAAGLDMPLHITAAAVICGAIVGDKLSPLSETTNLAPLCAGVNLYQHIRSMMWTTIPAAVISLIFFFILGQQTEVTSTELPEGAVETMRILADMYNWNPLLLLPFVVILIAAFTKQPPHPTMVGASLLALAIGGLYQGFNAVDGFASAITGFTTDMIYANPVSDAVAELLNRGGMTSMVGIVVVIYCGYAYAAIISKAGFLETAVAPILHAAKTRFSLIAVTLFTDLIVLCCSGSSYPASIMTAEIYKREFVERGIDRKVLSRCLEDVGTMVAPLIPWGGSGAFYITTLGVAAFGSEGFVPYCVNAYLNPVMALICAATGIGIYKLSKEQQKKELEELDKEENAL